MRYVIVVTLVILLTLVNNTWVVCCFAVVALAVLAVVKCFSDITAGFLSVVIAVETLVISATFAEFC